MLSLPFTIVCGLLFLFWHLSNVPIIAPEHLMSNSYALLSLVFPLGGLMARMPAPVSLLDFGSMSDLCRFLIPAVGGRNDSTGATLAP